MTAAVFGCFYCGAQGPSHDWFQDHTCKPPRAAIPSVVVTLPPGAAPGTQVAVRHHDWGVEVDVRDRPSGTWLPLVMAGGSFEVRP